MSRRSAQKWSLMIIATLMCGSLAPQATPPIGQRLRRVSEERAKSAGWPAAWRDLCIDELNRAWSEILSGPAPGTLGGPRRDATWRELIRFYDGRVAFKRRFTAEEGLGPTYNDVSCASCHTSPVLGGGGKDMGQGITVHGPPWTGGDAMGLRKHAISGVERERAAGKTARLRTPPLFGLGLLDAVPEAVRASLEDPKDRDGDGIKGVRSYRNGEGLRKPARFGQKANDWDLKTFIAGALVDEMGVTNTVRREPRGDHDKVSDPEVPSAFIHRLDAYVRLLAAPGRGAVNEQTRRGEVLFSSIGCVGCHRPLLGAVAGAYTDTLLHDMGPALDSGLKDGAATGSMWRTAPLWGLRFRERYTHDERASSVDEVMRLHQGEASGPSSRYFALTGSQREDLEAFLKSL